MWGFFVRKIRCNMRSVSRILSVIHFYHPWLFRLQIHTVSHCNLNCKGCVTCSPLAEKTFADAEIVGKDLACLASKIRFSTIGFIGGETLLHPEIERLICYARKYYPKVALTLSTNGILLPEMPASFWDTLRKRKVTILLQCYPPFKHRLGDYLRLAHENRVRIVNAPHGWSLYRCSFNADISMREKNYAMCNSNIGCHQLWQSKLYLCSWHCIEYYNRYFGTNHEIIKGWDIYKYSGRELQKFMSRSDPCCRYCTWASNPIETEWNYSEREKYEWCEDVPIK